MFSSKMVSRKCASSDTIQDDESSSPSTTTTTKDDERDYKCDDALTTHHPKSSSLPMPAVQNQDVMLAEIPIVAAVPLSPSSPCSSSLPIQKGEEEFDIEQQCVSCPKSSSPSSSSSPLFVPCSTKQLKIIFWIVCMIGTLFIVAAPVIILFVGPHDETHAHHQNDDPTTNVPNDDRDNIFNLPATTDLAGYSFVRHDIEWGGRTIEGSCRVQDQRGTSIGIQVTCGDDVDGDGGTSRLLLPGNHTPYCKQTSVNTMECHGPNQTLIESSSLYHVTVLCYSPSPDTNDKNDNKDEHQEPQQQRYDVQVHVMDYSIQCHDAYRQSFKFETFVTAESYCAGGSVLFDFARTSDSMPPCLDCSLNFDSSIGFTTQTWSHPTTSCAQSMVRHAGETCWDSAMCSDPNSTCWDGICTTMAT